MLFLLPGVGYTAQAPLLDSSTELFVASGWKVVAFQWEAEDDEGADPDQSITLQVGSAIEEHGVPDAYVAKTFGTRILPRAVTNNVPGIPLTAVLDHSPVSEKLTRAPSSHLAIGGTADPYWSLSSAVTVKAQLVSFHKSDRSLSLPRLEWNDTYSLYTKVFARIEQRSRHDFT